MARCDGSPAQSSGSSYTCTIRTTRPTRVVGQGGTGPAGAREPLANVVCCRVALRSDAASAKLGQEFAYNGKPLFLVITKNRTPMSRTEGAVTELEFYTYITLPVTRAPTSE